MINFLTDDFGNVLDCPRMLYVDNYTSKLDGFTVFLENMNSSEQNMPTD